MAHEGQVAIVTTPARVKVYVDDVYHGLTPVTLDLPPGAQVLHFRRDGARRSQKWLLYGALG